MIPQPLHPIVLTPTVSRYKMTCEYTWPNHLMATDREATQTLLEQHGFQDDVAYGHTQVFIRTPHTLFCLEQERAQLIPIIVLLLQKVGAIGFRPNQAVTGLSRGEWGQQGAVVMVWRLAWGWERGHTMGHSVVQSMGMAWAKHCLGHGIGVT